ncbi:MAG: sialidase family protein [Niameybacter sp.]
MSELKQVSIETYDQDGFKSYRIPGVVVSSQGTIIVYYETRLSAYDDWSAKGIGMKRSVDGGKTFSERQMIAISEDLAINNPLMIASKDGSIHFLWQKDYRQLFYQVSTDDGLTFSEPVSIMDAMMKFRPEYEWSLFAVGPGHGIELSNGRLVVPVWLARGEGNNHYPTHVSTIISDDGGMSWHCGEMIYSSDNGNDDFVWVNESQVVELSDGSVLINMRHNGKLRYRYTAISPNGQNQFSAPAPDMQLPDAICFGSIVKTEDKILFVNCANNKELRANGWPKRIDLTVRISYDDAKSWKYSKKIAGLAGYADIATSPDGKTYYCFFEDGNPPDNEEPARLTLAIFDEAYLVGAEA